MATLFHQQQKNSNNNKNNSNTAQGTQGTSTTTTNLTLKKLANGNTVLVGNAVPTTANHNNQIISATTAIADNNHQQQQQNHHHHHHQMPQQQQMQTNHAPGTTIILNQNGYSLPAKFVLPSTVAGGTIIQQNQLNLNQLNHHHHQPTQIIQLAPQPLSGVPGAYQIVTSNGMNSQQQPKIISISNSGQLSAGGQQVIINGSGGGQVANGHHQNQFVSANGNILRIVPAGSMTNNNNNNSSGTMLGSNSVVGTPQVIQVMGADGRIVTLTGIKKQAMTTTTGQLTGLQPGTVISGGRILNAGGGQVVTQLNNNNNMKPVTTTFATLVQNNQNQQQIVTSGSGQMMARGLAQGQGLGTSGGTVMGTTTMAAGTIILDKNNTNTNSIATTTTTMSSNRISNAGGVGIVVAQTNNNNNSNNCATPTAINNTTNIINNINSSNINNSVMQQQLQQHQQQRPVHPHMQQPPLQSQQPPMVVNQLSSSSSSLSNSSSHQSNSNGQMMYSNDLHGGLGTGTNQSRAINNINSSHNSINNNNNGLMMKTITSTTTDSKSIVGGGTGTSEGTLMTTSNSNHASATNNTVQEQQGLAEGGQLGQEQIQESSSEVVPATADPNAAQTEEGDEPEIDIVINNVVCSFSVRCHLNLREIALNGHNVEFRRENGMVTMKLRKPYTTASMWSSGKITCTGATSEENAKIAARRYARCLQKLEFKTRLHNFRIVNVLGTCHMPWDIKITNFSERHRQDASYEPELHPGVTYKLKVPKATLKIFSTGSVTVTSASVSNVQEAIEFIFPLLYEFRKERPKAAVASPEPPEVAAALAESSDEEVFGADSDDNVTKEGRLKEDSFWSDEDENGKSMAGRSYCSGKAGVAKKRRFEGKSSSSSGKPKVGRFAKNSKPHRRRRPLGKASNDPNEDVMEVSDVDDPNDY